MLIWTYHKNLKRCQWGDGTAVMVMKIVCSLNRWHIPLTWSLAISIFIAPFFLQAKKNWNEQLLTHRRLFIKTTCNVLGWFYTSDNTWVYRNMWNCSYWSILANIHTSSSSCRAISTDILDLLSPLLPIVHCFWQDLRATSRILTELLYVGTSWSPCFCSAMWRCP